MSSSSCLGQGQVSYQKLISAEECEQILRKALGSDDATVIAYEISKIPGHIGFLGEYLLLHVTAEVGLSRTDERFLA